MRILVSGASGLLGSALVRHWTGAEEIVRLVRWAAPQAADEVSWDPQAGRLDPGPLEGLDAVVHLAGENVGTGRWTPAKKARIRDSRVQGTTLLARTLAGLSRPPKTLLSASAVGYYGDRGDAKLDETSSLGEGFLAEVCRDWEAATAPAAAAGIRVVPMRFAVVLAPDGGALAPMVRLFRFGLGGRLGSGRQYVSWIAEDDLVAAVDFLMRRNDLAGPVNVAAPSPVTNAELTKALARALGRPAIVPAPALALRLALGEMADEMLLSSARVVPRRLLDAGFVFRYPAIEAALRRVL